MQEICENEGQLIWEALRWFDDNFRSRFLQVLTSEIRYFRSTSEILIVLGRLEKLLKLFGPPLLTDSKVVEEEELPFIKRVLLDCRRSIATEFEGYKAATIHPEVISDLDGKVAPYDNLLKADWLLNVEPMTLPRLSEYIPTEHLERLNLAETYEAVPDNLQMATQREYDEKFHILRAPTLFIQDLKRLREQCELRRRPLVVAYIDIDNFGQFNRNYGETLVDINVLPSFMRAIEAHLFGHGYAYRQGGDEYLLLLPNLGFELASIFFDELREALASIPYREISEKTTVSIGFCYVPSDCHLTDREALEKANEAKRFAKKTKSKNCIATFTIGRFDDLSLHILNMSQHPKRLNKAEKDRKGG